MEKQLTVEEIKEIKDLNNFNYTLVQRLGELEMDQLYLNMKKKELEADFNKFQEMSSHLAKKLQDKYGEGVVNIEEGKIETSE